MCELSVLIPARNEDWLCRTVQDLLEHTGDATEVIVVLDGQWADPPLPQHERLVVIYQPVPIGQRAACNLAARIARGKYVAKVDAHCAFDDAWDRKMLDAFREVGDDVTMVSTMRNLHVFDWVCPDGHRQYQDKGSACLACGKECTREVLWVAKKRPESNSYCFDSEPHFQYGNAFTKRPGYQNGIIIGYALSFTPGGLASDFLEKGSLLPFGRPQPSFVPSIISLLTDFAGSHQFTGAADSSGGRKDVAVDTVSLPSVDDSRGVGSGEVLLIGDELQVGGVAAPSVLADVIDDGDVLAPPPGNWPNGPRIKDAVYHFMLAEVGTVSISGSVKSPLPIPTSGDTINSNVIDELNKILGGEFLYNEKAGRFHNGSVALTPIHDKDISETMSLQGSCFMLTKAKWFDLDVCDESWGSWGSQGIEVAVKTWLSGGRVLVNRRTWYAHLFRTKGDVFGFPYPQSGRQVEGAKRKARDLFFNNRWPKQVRPLHWLVERFAPVPGWSDADLEALRERGRDFSPAAPGHDRASGRD